LEGEIPSPIAVPPGCNFHPRCPIAELECRAKVPVLEPKEAGSEAACRLVS